MLVVSAVATRTAVTAARVDRVSVTDENPAQRSVGHYALPTIWEAGNRAGNLQTPGHRFNPAINPVAVAFGGSVGASGVQPPSSTPVRASFRDPLPLQRQVNAMANGTGRVNALRLFVPSLAVACLLVPAITVAQGLTGALIGTVTDAAGGVISGAAVRISSPALIGGELTTKTDERGQLRFPSVPPGSYVLEIVLEGFRPYRDADIRIGAGATIERTPVLTLAALADSIVVHGVRLAPRRPKPGLRDPVRRRGPRRDPHEAIQLPGLGQDRARHLADVSVRQQRPRVRLRFRRGSESVSPRWHEHHRDRQRRVEGRSRRRLHSGTADPVGGRVGRVRQRPGRRRQRHHQIRREPLSIRCGLLLADRTR